MLITSRNNPAIKQIRSLRQRKERAASGQFYIEGIRLVAEALQLGAAVESLVVAPELLTSAFASELVAGERQRGRPIIEVSGDVFASLSAKDGPQGLGAVVRQHWSALEEIDPAAGLCWVALDAVQDPGNLGAILRSGDAVGCAGVILLGACTDPFDPATARASMGALFAQRLVAAGWDEFADWKRRRGVTVAGLAGAAADDYQAASYPAPLCLLMGSEREGLAPEHQALCDLVVSIPMVGRSDSLNLAAATSVALYEVFNQRRR